MIGVQEKEQVERFGNLGLRDVILIRLGEHHVQEVFRITQLVLGVRVGLAEVVLVSQCCNRRHLRDHAIG